MIYNSALHFPDTNWKELWIDLEDWYYKTNRVVTLH